MPSATGSRSIQHQKTQNQLLSDIKPGAIQVMPSMGHPKAHILKLARRTHLCARRACLNGTPQWSRARREERRLSSNSPSLKILPKTCKNPYFQHMQPSQNATFSSNISKIPSFYTCNHKSLKTQIFIKPRRKPRKRNSSHTTVNLQEISHTMSFRTHFQQNRLKT